MDQEDECAQKRVVMGRKCLLLTLYLLTIFGFLAANAFSTNSEWHFSILLNGKKRKLNINRNIIIQNIYKL